MLEYLVEKVDEIRKEQVDFVNRNPVASIIYIGGGYNDETAYELVLISLNLLKDRLELMPTLEGALPERFLREVFYQLSGVYESLEGYYAPKFWEHLAVHIKDLDEKGSVRLWRQLDPKYSRRRFYVDLLNAIEKLKGEKQKVKPLDILFEIAVKAYINLIQNKEQGRKQPFITL
jgi:hypothetical protein